MCATGKEPGKALFLHKKHQVRQYLVYGLMAPILFLAIFFLAKPKLENLCQNTDSKSRNELNE
ncbi:hypothetical protein EFO31_02925 [Lactococcus lactis]|nr:hypothetical protein [Lactococcus lactis]